MSKDYRYQREEWDPVEEELGDKKMKSRREHEIKAKQRRDMQRREKQRRLQQESF